jgi:predicted RNase H-like HicB family nuclease
MKYRVGITQDEHGTQATVFDLPGCCAHAGDRAALDTLLPVAIAEHISWLARHGEAIEAHSIDIEVVEEVDPRASAAADGEFCFADDRRPLTDEEIETAIRWMSYATSDLLALVGSLPDAVLDWRPAPAAMARIDVWQPNVKTIREIARELPGSERYYRLGLGEASERAESEHEWFDRAVQRRRTIERLRSLRNDERSKLFFVTRPWQDRPEEWTARKATRRIIGHERFHMKETEQRVAWLLLGVPDFTKVRTLEGATTHA